MNRARKIIAAIVLGSAWAVSGGAWAQTGTDVEPKIQSYTIDTEIKLLSDRKTNGLSDTFNQPGAELTVDMAHETGLVGHFQLASVSRKQFTGGSEATLLGAVGWRGGNPDALHYGVGVAGEWFPGAKASAPSDFGSAIFPGVLQAVGGDPATAVGYIQANVNPAFTGPSETRTQFDTHYLIGEMGYGIFNARYLYVIGTDFRGVNTTTACGQLLQYKTMNGTDVSTDAQSIGCYGSGTQHSDGTQILDLNVAYPLNGQTRLLGNLGYQKVKNFKPLDATFYRLGVEYTQWGFVFGADVAGASMRDRRYAVALDTASGKQVDTDRTVLILSIAKRF